MIAASPLATAVCNFLDQERKEWLGIATDLLDELREFVSDQISRDKKLWPQTGKRLSENLNRVAPALRRVGVEIERHSGKNNARLIKLYRIPEGLNSAPAAPLAPELNTTANVGKLQRTTKNDSKQEKLPKFARKPDKK